MSSSMSVRSIDVEVMWGRDALSVSVCTQFGYEGLCVVGVWFTSCVVGQCQGRLQ